MSEIPNVRGFAAEAVSNFIKVYKDSIVSAGTFNDSDIVVVDCHLSGKRLVIASIPESPLKIGVGVGNKKEGSVLEVIEFDKKTFSPENIFNLMNGNFVKTLEEGS
ncbi:MAG: hypothetical protein PF450_06535 [Bacteroidales bacterium]|jgi:hypothetical protein|nr:hypothetical protein [Bacteroidales bacterium]